MNILNFALMNDLIPAVIQDFQTNEVLMVGYLNPNAWQLTLQDGKVYYYSRKKRRIWLKGEQSGNYQFVKKVYLNCDNTCLLIKVEQVGGACDQGFKSCFDKMLVDDHFEMASVKVFEPQDAYGVNFTPEIRLGIPSGSLSPMTMKLLGFAGYEIDRVSERSYQPKIKNASNIKLCMFRAQELPILVSQGVLDAAITGMDLVLDSDVSVKDVCDLQYNKLGLGKVMLALAVSKDADIKRLSDFEGKRIATAYQKLTYHFFKEQDVNVKIIVSNGATEGKIPLLADAIIELVETGSTLQANNLKPLLKVYETTVHLISNTESWGYTWKRRALEELGDKLLSGVVKLPKNVKQVIDLPSTMLLTI